MRRISYFDGQPESVTELAKNVSRVCYEVAPEKLTVVPGA
jgi:hypothetical protein